MLGPCHAARPELAPALPLVALVPRGLVLTGMQQTHHLFAGHCGTSRGKNALVKQSDSLVEARPQSNPAAVKSGGKLKVLVLSTAGRWPRRASK